MATVPGTLAVGAPPSSLRLAHFPDETYRMARLTFRYSGIRTRRIFPLGISRTLPPRSENFVPFPASGGIQITEAGEIQQSQLGESSDDAAIAEDDASDGEISRSKETLDSAISELLRSYNDALASNDESKVAEVEAFLKSIQEERASLKTKVANLSADLSMQKDRILRISAKFNNFRQRAERERLNLVSNARGEVLENLLPVLNNFEKAKAQMKFETEGEEKINKSYESIYKQFIEVLSSLGPQPVERVGKPYDPLVGNNSGSKFRFALQELYQTLQEKCSGFWKTWIRF